ncbi:isochorismatase family protein [Flagellimonas marinaquae]|nr:hydrolase [Allomuricauda sp.]UBZ14609.1 isochorismatase family protein [Allomuricauda aquimarina]
MNDFKFETLDPENAALLLIDQQTGLAQCVRDMSPETWKNNAIAIAKIGKVFDLPTILTTSAEDGANGPLLPEIVEMYPDAPFIARGGEINAWDNPEFKKAVEATGRKKLIIAGVSTDVCVLFPSLSALAEGYDVYSVIDASGTWSEIAQTTTVSRLTQAGAKVTSWMSVSAELQKDWRNPTGQGLGALYADHLQAYGHLFSSLSAAQKAVAQL